MDDAMVNGHTPEFSAPSPAVPAVGSAVLYMPRPGESRRQALPALVMSVADPAVGAVELLVFVDAMNFMQQRFVLPWRDGERGWQPVADSVTALRDDVDGFKVRMAEAVLGENEVPTESILDQLAAMREELVELRVLIAEARTGSKKASAPARGPAPAKRR